MLRMNVPQDGDGTQVDAMSVASSVRTTPSDRVSLERIRRWLNDRCGIYYPDNKRELLVHRLQRVCERFQFDKLAELSVCLERGNPEDILIATMHAASTNHSYFFREPLVLHSFRDKIFPELLKKSKQIRIWSAAASSGDEAHTIAIIAAELYGLPWVQDSLSVLGTDISEPMIAHAESGIYRSSHLEQTPAAIIGKYMKPTGIGQYRVIDDIRKVCTFRRLNLKSRPYPFQKSFHCIFCRNVLYYFDKEHQLQTVEALYDLTEPGGWLVTSVTESLRDLNTRWRVVESGIYRKI